jgi:geranylgeranyl diphosphate synthase, type II
MKTIAELRDIFNAKLAEDHYESAPVSLYEPINYIMSIGGKRLRPILVLMSAQLFGRDPAEVLDAAMGVEVFHNFTLVHDDIMDHSPIRRGKPTVHNKWNQSTAILAGDTMMVLAYDYFLHCSTDNVCGIISTFNQVAREVCEGQQYDMDFEVRQDVSIDEYMEMIRLKTAVLLAASLKIGGLMAEASEKDLDHLYRFGEHLGLAFQLRDDYLDVFGNVEKFGKQTGNDILTNKKTYLLVKCLQDACSDDRAEIMQWLARDDDPQGKISAITAMYRKYRIPEQLNEMIESLNETGMTFLKEIDAEESAKAPLYEVCQSLQLRDN